MLAFFLNLQLIWLYKKLTAQFDNLSNFDRPYQISEGEQL